VTMNYATIKDLAKDTGCKVDTLIALARGNDPFYIGTPSDWKQARWFAEMWQRFGYSENVHLRRIHYRLVSDDPPARGPTGEPYENTDKCWARLCKASKSARYLGLVDGESFDDRRNPAPSVSAESAAYTEIYLDAAESWGFKMGLPAFPRVPGYVLSGYEQRQPYLLEVWCEKSTMNDVLQPLCRKYHANYLTSLGEFSITSVIQAAQRIAEDGRPAVILFVSDFDPAGRSIPLAVARKLEYYLVAYAPDSRAQVVPVALTEAQCKHYRLPRTPIKKSELRRGTFETQFGTGATELDALEALHPDSLYEIVEEAMRAYYDPTLVQRVSEARDAAEWSLRHVQTSLLDEFMPEIDQLHDEYGELKGEFRGRLSDFETRRERVWHAIRDKLSENQPDDDAFLVPEPEPVPGIDDPLFDSGREYLDQLSVYKLFQGKE